MSKLCKEGCGRPTERPDTSRCRTCRRNRKAQKAVRHGGPRVLLIDIETSPDVVYRWGKLYTPQSTGLEQVIETGRMLCFAAKWLGDDEVMFYSEHTHDRKAMLASAWLLLDEADVVVHYYGSRFDVPWLNTCFITEALMTPPSPFKQVDLKQAVSKRFMFPSNKLEFVSKALGLDGKVKHEGFSLWKSCLAGDAAAWKRMEKYNRRDVTLLEELYARLLPWIPSAPHRHLYGGTGACPNCGDDDVISSGLYRTALSAFDRYTCNACGSWFRGSKRVQATKLQAAAL